MRREDWFWVAVKVIGLWLVVEGICQVAVTLSTTDVVRGGLSWRVFVPILVPLGIGLFLLLGGERLVPPREAAMEAPDGSGMTGRGLFWAASKTIGLLLVIGSITVCLTVLVIPGAEHLEGLPAPDLSWKRRVYFAAFPVALFGTWLLLGESVYRAATRNADPL